MRLKLSRNVFFYIIVLFIIFILRFWKIGDLFFFGIDEEYQSLLALSIVKDFHVIWIGLSAANTGYFVGPGLVYIHALLLWISKLDPIILGYAASLTGVVTSLVLYGICHLFFHKRVAIIAPIIYGISSFVVIYDRRFWNSTFVPLTVLLFLFSYLKAQVNSRWYIFTAFLIASSFHIHASMFIFIPITLTVIFYQWKSKKLKLDLFTIISSVVVYFLITLPLAVYDIVHNYDNLKTPFRMIQQIGKGSGSGFSIFQNFIMFKNTLSQFWMSTSHHLFIIPLFLFSICILLWFLLKKKSVCEQIISIIIGWYLLLLMFYPGKVLDYYYIGFFPFFAIVVGIFLKNVNKKILVLAISLFIIYNIRYLSMLPTTQGLESKKQLIKIVSKEIGDNSFYLSTNQDYLYFGGWRYLFEAYGKKPASSQADSMFGWIYNKEISSSKPQLEVMISNSEIVPIKKVLKEFKEGSYYTYILNNN